MTYGALWNQVWSFSGNTQRADVNQMFLQPFFAYQATRTLTVTLQSESTANWEVEEDRWTVPINLILSKLSSFGVVPASYQLGVGGFAAHPDVGPSLEIRGASSSFCLVGSSFRSGDDVVAHDAHSLRRASHRRRGRWNIPRTFEPRRRTRHAP